VKLQKQKQQVPHPGGKFCIGVKGKQLRVEDGRKKVKGKRIQEERNRINRKKHGKLGENQEYEGKLGLPQEEISV